MDRQWWVCRGCEAQMMGPRPADDLCALCARAAAAELEARLAAGRREPAER